MRKLGEKIKSFFFGDYVDGFDSPVYAIRRFIFICLLAFLAGFFGSLAFSHIRQQSISNASHDAYQEAESDSLGKEE